MWPRPAALLIACGPLVPLVSLLLSAVRQVLRGPGGEVRSCASRRPVIWQPRWAASALQYAAQDPCVVLSPLIRAAAPGPKHEPSETRCLCLMGAAAALSVQPLRSTVTLPFPAHLCAATNPSNALPSLAANCCLSYPVLCSAASPSTRTAAAGSRALCHFITITSLAILSTPPCSARTLA